MRTDHRIRSAQRPRRLVPARAAVALTVVAALLLPGAFALTAPDPDWLLGVAPAAGHARDHGSSGDSTEDSSIPGSPGHPADHDCAPCQVLKYLASWLPRMPLVVAASAPAIAPRVEHGEPQRTACLSSLPPSRAPPGFAA